MTLVTLDEVKNFLSIDNTYKDGELTVRADAVESYLSYGTGLNLETLTDEKTIALCRDYIFMALYLDYYDLHSEINDKRLTMIICQLKVVAQYAQ